MFSLVITNSFGGGVAPLPQDRGAPFCVVGIGRQNVDASLVKHPLGPIKGAAAEPPRQRGCRDLHPDAGARQPLDGAIVRFDPGQPFRMRQNWYKAGHEQLKKQLFQPHRHGVMRRFNKHITRIGQRQ